VGQGAPFPTKENPGPPPGQKKKKDITRRKVLRLRAEAMANAEATGSRAPTRGATAHSLHAEAGEQAAVCGGNTS